MAGTGSELMWTVRMPGPAARSLKGFVFGFDEHDEKPIGCSIPRRFLSGLCCPGKFSMQMGGGSKAGRMQKSKISLNMRMVQ